MGGLGAWNLRSQIATSRLDLIRPEVEKECPHAGGVHDQERDSRSRDDAPRAGFALAVNRSIRELALLKRLHGPGRWRKLKGEAIVELPERGAWPWAMGRSLPPNCIGTKRTESAVVE